jgi:hypothetical protein
VALQLVQTPGGQKGDVIKCQELYETGRDEVCFW